MAEKVMPAVNAAIGEENWDDVGETAALAEIHQ